MTTAMATARRTAKTIGLDWQNNNLICTCNTFCTFPCGRCPATT